MERIGKTQEFNHAFIIELAADWYHRLAVARHAGRVCRRSRGHRCDRGSGQEAGRPARPVAKLGDPAATAAGPATKSAGARRSDQVTVGRTLVYAEVI